MFWPRRYTRLSAFYFFYFGALGVYLPYWAPYLDSIGFDSLQIGSLLAVVLISKALAPYATGCLGDYFANSRLHLLRSLSLLSFLCFCLLFFSLDYAGWLFVCFLFSFFWNAALPKAEAITLDSLGHAHYQYSKIRLWGSIGFIVCSFFSAFLVERYGLPLVPWLVAALLFLLWPGSCLLSDRRQKPRPYQSVFRPLSAPPVLLLLALCAAAQLSHGPYYAFFSLYMRDHGYSEVDIGLLWAFAVFAEVIAFVFMPSLLRRFGALSLFAASFLFAALRWCLIACLPENLPVVIAAQAMHALSFGVYHASAISLIDRWFPAGFQVRGQSLYSGISFGVGGALGVFIAGWLRLGWSDAEIFLLSAAVASLGFLLACYLHRRVRPRDLKAL